ncbi:MAG: hypothetical protein M1830_002758 [Pleopsidium flavum]|nr:MAG: hypothetical protein M1830_002758 [Pleopsidium flavum]
MASGPPAGYLDLQTASDRHNVDLNIMGVVVDFLPPSRSRGTDYMSTFTIVDSTLGGYGDGLKARFFRPMESELPCIRGTGDVIILRNVKIKLWSGMTIALSNGNTGWTVFPAAAIPESLGQGKVQLAHKKTARMQPPTVAESLYAISLCNSQDRSTFSPPIELTTAANSSSPVVASPVIASPRQKFSFIKDVKIDSFYDLVGQIVKKYSNNGRCELYLTDYTSNNLLYNYEWGHPEGDGAARDGDSFGYTARNSRHQQWPGPYGKMTLQVALWAPHSYFAMDNVKEEDYIHLRNVRIKFGQDARMEGALHTDRRYPDRIDVTILKDHEDDRVKDVMRRKREYWNRAKSQGAEFLDFARGEKRKQPEGGGAPKGRGKKRKQQQQQEQQKASRESESAKGLTLDRYELNKHSKPI